MNLRHTERGFAVADFTDANGELCSIQDSSLATEAAIRFGVDNAIPKLLIKHAGWVPLQMPEGTLISTRMHLTVDQVRELLPYLRRFVQTGSIEGNPDAT